MRRTETCQAQNTTEKLFLPSPLKWAVYAVALGVVVESGRQARFSVNEQFDVAAQAF